MKRFGLFRIGQFDFAISLLQIRKILQNSAIYTLPCLPRFVSAVLVDDAQLIPLLNLGQLSGKEIPQGQFASGYQVIVNSEYGTVALPSDLTGRIVAAAKGELVMASEKKEFGVVGTFKYQNDNYNILDIDFLAIGIARGFWQNQPDTGSVRRHQ